MPGPFFSEDGHWGTVKKNNPELFEKFAQERMSIKRLGQPSEIAAVVLFLCSVHASFMPGAIVPVTGGIR